MSEGSSQLKLGLKFLLILMKIYGNICEGMSDFDECMNDQPMEECISIFDPRPYR